MPYRSTTGGSVRGTWPSLAATMAEYRWIRSSSMQPPETDPTTAPSSRRAMIEPTGRGEDPQVRITVAGTAPRPCARQASTVRRTCRSRFSIRGPLSSWALHGAAWEACRRPPPMSIGHWTGTDLVPIADPTARGTSHRRRRGFHHGAGPEVLQAVPRGKPSMTTTPQRENRGRRIANESGEAMPGLCMGRVSRGWSYPLGILYLTPSHSTEFLATND